MYEKLRPLLRYAAYIAVGAALLWVFAPKSSGPELGKPAPTFALPRVHAPFGNIDLTALRGQPLVLEAFAGWCAACRQLTPMLSDAARASRIAPVRFIGVSVDESHGAAESVRQAWQIPYDVVHDDGRFSELYRVKLLPTVIVIDAHGTVYKVATGKVSRSQLEHWLSEVGAASR